jgi:GNAT superfamily N-acetyltransferase
MKAVADANGQRPLAAHLASYLGTWPPATAVDVVGSAARLAPAWDGMIVLAVAVRSPAGTVISVPPAAVEAARAMAGEIRDPGFGDRLAAVVGAPRRASSWLVLRWSTEPADFPPTGRWVDPSDPALPAWLNPFPPPVLAAIEDDGTFLAGVGIKPHTERGKELAVGTAEPARGRGLGRRLVAQAAQHVLAEGAVPLYVHHPDNQASARVADAAGFPDLAWRLLVVSAPPRWAP